MTGDKHIVEMQDGVNAIVSSMPGVLQVHGMFINPTAHIISFDIVIDFSVNDITAFKKEINERLVERYPGFNVRIHIDKDWCD